MRTGNAELEGNILEKTRELLQKKEPYEIGMRDIAKECGVTATSIYLHYKDKNDLFRRVSLYSLKKLESYILLQIQKTKDAKKQISLALRAFRDWCFDNPRTAMLFMGKIEVDENASEEELSAFYGCNRMGQELLVKCINEKKLKSKNSVLDTDVLVYSLWGCVESILLKRATPELWENKIEYTDRVIELLIKGLEK